MHICITYIDSKTKIPDHKQTRYNGFLSFYLKRFNIVYGNKFNFPFAHLDQLPRVYSTCDDDIDISIPEKNVYNKLYKMKLNKQMPESLGFSLKKLNNIFVAVSQTESNTMDQLSEEKENGN